MSDRPKVQSTAILKNLPADRQAQIFEWCSRPNDRDYEGKPIAGTGGLALARAELAKDGLKVSIETLSQFRRWYEIAQDMTASFEVEDQVLAAGGDPKRAREAAEGFLIRRGLAREDAELTALGAKLHDDRRTLELQEKSAETKARQKDKQLAQKDEDLQIAKQKLAMAERKMAEAKSELEKLRDPQAALSDADRAAIVAKVDEILGIK